MCTAFVKYGKDYICGFNMDINAGAIVTEGASFDDIRKQILQCIEQTASGVPTKSEALGHREYSLGYKSFGCMRL